MPVIIVKSIDGSKLYQLPEGKPLFIGRAKECDIVLASTPVSRRHAVVIYKNGLFGVKDLGSFNGTNVNGRPITEATQLREEDVLKISPFILHVRLQEEPAKSTPAEPIPPSPKPKTPNPDTRSFANGMRLPRAMAMHDEVDDLIGAIPGNPAQSPFPQVEGGTKVFQPGGDTREFIKKEEAAGRLEDMDTASYPAVTDATPIPDSSAATQCGMPSQSARRAGNTTGIIASPSGDVAGQPTPDDTSYFKEAPLVDLLRRRVLEEDAAVAEQKAQPSSLTEDAEAVIPLFEPDVTPVLTLETDVQEDVETRSALERLIDDDEPAVVDLPPPLSTGEFTVPPSTDEYSKVEQQREPEPAPAGRTDTDVVAAPARKIETKSRAPAFSAPAAGADKIPLSPHLMDAINTRLGLYSLLFDLSEERKEFRQANPGMSADLSKELDRQDAELNSLPTTEEVERNMGELQRRQSEYSAPDDLQQAVDEMAISQWLLIRDSNREALPPVYKEAYKLMADEPLARDLCAARISHGRLMGGAIYLLVLETLAASADTERKQISTRMRRLSEEGTEKGKSSILSKLGRLGKLANNYKNRDDIRQETAKLAQKDKANAIRSSLAAREMAFMEKTLIPEFRQLYLKTALRFVPDGDNMPFSVRAFLRHGAIGFKPWWMRPEIREFIFSDCMENVVQGFERGAATLNIVYADEYLAAVAKMECSASPDERLTSLGKSSTEWKTDRAYRRIVNARTYNSLMEEMLSGLNQRIEEFDVELQILEERMETIRTRPYASKDSMFDLQTEHQTVGIRRSNLEKHIKRIENEVVSSIIDSVEKAEGHFRKGEFSLPDSETLIRREVESLIDLSRGMEGSRDRFLPLVIRDNYSTRGDVLNDRGAIRFALEECERFDPSLFVNTIIAAKKKVNRVELRLSPTVILIPALGLHGVCSIAREGMEGGHLVLPTCFGRENVRRRLISNMLADFRWETSRNQAGRDIMNSDTLVGAFMKIRWEWRNQSKAKREKGLIFNELTDQMNWRRVYELILSDSMTGCRQLFQRNPDCYAAIIGTYIDLPEGIRPIRKSSALDKAPTGT